jgi:DNA invertase Pin-like site-specific DNA recombinase
MAGLTVGYARCSTDGQDLAVQREALEAMGVSPGCIYVDHGLTGTTGTAAPPRETSQK